MQNSSMYLGIVIGSEDEDGKMTVRYHGHGPDYHGLEYADTVAMEGVLAQFAEDQDALSRKMESALLEAGFAKAGLGQPGKPGP